MKLSKQRLEAMSDGVIAIIITIMVLGIPLPLSAGKVDILNFLLSIFIYFVSFIVTAAFWNQHHKAFSWIEDVDHRIVAANFLFLFFLSLIPLFTKWVIENPGELLPAAGYDILYLLVNFCYMMIVRLIASAGRHGDLEAIRKQGVWLSESERRSMWWILSISCLLVGGVIVALSVWLPGISTLVLLGIPILSSASSLFAGHSARMKRLFRKHKKFIEIANRNRGAVYFPPEN